MRPLIEGLYSLLVLQKGSLETMLELAGDQRRIIISGETDLLEDIVRRELKEVSNLNALEKKRAAMHKDIAAEFGITEKEVTVSAIAERAAPDEREALKELQAELTVLIGQHKTLNKENRELIQTQIEYSDAIMELMVESEDPLNNFYGGDGRTTPDRKKTTGFFDGSA